MRLHVVQPGQSPGESSPSGGLSANEASDLAGALQSPASRVSIEHHRRMLFATDASMYQVEPLAVVSVGDAEDARRAVEWCGEWGVAILPRGGGTSLAGQCTARAVVIDTSPGLRGVGRLNVEARTIEAEPGVALDDLNAELSRRGGGLFFAPDPATSAQATVGGCIGNNAAGSRSVLYGRTVDSVEAIDAALVSGARVRFGRGGGRAPGQAGAVALKLAEGVARIVRRHATLIRERYPRTLRRNAGYALDLVLDQLDAGVEPRDLDLVPLLCGSEGTLAVTLGATLRLHPVPAGKALVLASFASVDEAIASVPEILGTRPSAVELVDDVVIEAARNNLDTSPFVDAFPRLDGRDPAAVLYIEYHRASAEAATADAHAIAARLRGAPARVLLNPADMGTAWKLRKAGEPLLHGLPGVRKPLTFIEDNAVPVESLARFVRELRAVIHAAGTRAAFWAHASVGVLHVRPLLNPHDERDLAILRDIAVKAADLARDCGGVMSGEHGDGKVRGPLLRRFFGDELAGPGGAFAQVKALFDPRGLLNPGNIVGAGDVASITQRTRITPRTPAVVPGVDTYYDYRDQTDFAHAVEMCNGAGVCRKSSGGTMCPSYRATLDERHSTRGRGNALRLAITGQSAERGDAAGPAWDDPGTIETLDLCLSCKACKAECPSNVDIARLKAEYTAQRYRAGAPVPLAARAIGHVRVLNRLGALAPGLANWGAGLRPVRALINRVMGVHPRRSLPPFSASLFRSWPGGAMRGRGEGAGSLGGKTAEAHQPVVVLLGDCFTAYNEVPIGHSARRVLQALGYRVEVLDAGCCARSMISVGLLREACATIDSTLARLAPVALDDRVDAVLVVEPSCLSAIADDWLHLRVDTDLATRRRVAAKCMSVEQFIESRWERHPRPAKVSPAAGPPVVLHSHCHQKAVLGTASTAALLRRVVGGRLRTPDTGCCGMAGSFGYAREKFDVSMRIANLGEAAPSEGGPTRVMPGGGVLPHVRAALRDDAGAMVVATGTSCRHQIKDGTGGTVRALHPVEVVEAAMGIAAP